MFKRSCLALAAAAAFMIPALSLAQMTIEERLAPGQPPLVIANLGHSGEFPENSLASIQQAIDRGIDMVKVDVQVTRDGQYVLMGSKAAFLRTTNVETVFPEGSPHRETQPAHARSYFVRDFAIEDIRRLRLRDEKGGKHPVPTLHEALELINGRILVILQLRTYEVESLYRSLATLETGNLLLYSLFDPSKLRDVVTATGIGAYVTLGRARDPTAELDRLHARFGPQLTMVDVMSKHLTPAFLAKANELGVLVGLAGDRHEDYALTRGDPGPWQSAFNSGALFFWTRHPYTVLQLLYE